MQIADLSKSETLLEIISALRKVMATCKGA